MAKKDPVECDYLAVVSEWSSTTPRGGVVGNAYPLVNLTTGEAVAAPRDEFPNPGAVFLINRGTLNTWDFIVVRPQRNDRYRDGSDRDCYYIPAKPPEPLYNPSQAENVAVVLEYQTFDVNAASRQIVNPRYSVTPLFFVQKHQTLIGPLLREVVTLSPMDDVLRIDWRPARDDGIVYEFSREELGKRGARVVEYSHPEQWLNRVIETPIPLVIGPVRKLMSNIARDALSVASLIEWYLQHCPTVEVSGTLLTSLKAAFRGTPGDDPVIQHARIQKIEREMATHAAFAELRDRFARQYIDSEPGRRRVAELMEQAVAKKASEVQAEVDRRESQLASRRIELEKQLQTVEREHQRQLERLRDEQEAAKREINSLKAAAGQLREELTTDVQQLAERMQGQLPLLAALTTVRHEAAGPVVVNTDGAVPTVPRQVRYDFRPVRPTAEVQPIEDEARLVNSLHADLARQGLFFARDFVANVYTCLKAEALNLIIGPPGYGKSSLVAGLARALGHGDAFLRIAVRRSWSEDRYLLGFFDSFHGQYDPGATGLVARMIQAERDWRQDRTGMYIVLLDEFNLAAPEYYFSQLLQSLPSDDLVREVVLYDEANAGEGRFPSRVTLGPNLRFWGTINYDETTERLSPRSLDRTGMIFLGDADVKPPLDDHPPPVPAVAAGDLFGKFVRDADECPEEPWEIVSPVIDFLRGPDTALGARIELSPRVKQAIQRYLANAAGVLDPRTAADFVIQQRILPVVRGQGEGFLARMRQFGQRLSDANLQRSALHVEEALRQSEQQFGELDFFSY